MVTLSPRSGKWIIGGLLASLAVNLFLGGLAVGRLINGPRFRVAGEASERLTGGQAILLTGPAQRLVQAIPVEHRPNLVRAFEAHRAALQSTGQSVREARAKLGEATVADPFNRASFVAAADQLSVRTQAQRKAFTEAIADGIATLPVDVRRDIVDAGRSPAAPSRRRSQ